ncbi:c-type cytochrome [Polyangium jinanense]|nr:c-type cytochrome [Polyangium jinanense]MDC3960445.1 c-type cytochrome [Polyangium jinanense]
MHWATRAFAIVVCLAVATTCERRDPPGVEAGTPSAPSANVSASSAKAAKRTSLTPVREMERSSSALALGRIGDETVAILADEDDAKLRVMKLPEVRELASAKLAGVPGHVLVGDDGTIWIAVRDADLVQSFTLTCSANGSECALAEGARIQTAKEPLALALADRALFVVSNWGRELARHALPSGEKVEATPLAREARAVLVSKDGRRLVIAHAAGSIVTTVSLSPGLPTREHHLDFRDHHLDESASIVIGDEPRFAGQGFALARAGDGVIVPMVLVYPGDPVPSSGYGSLESPYFPNEPVLVALADSSEDAPPKLRVRREVLPADKPRSGVERASSPKTPPCLLPRAAAADEARGSILVACAGIDQLLEIDATDAPLATSELRRWHLPSGPSAIAIDPRTHDAWVWSALDRKLTRIVLGSPGAQPDAGKAVVSIHDADASTAVASDTPLDPDWERGRRLFHGSLAPDGRACASCHPDGRTDGLTWSSPKGPLQTPMLAGRLSATAPFGWVGDSPAVEAHLKLTLDRLGARSLDDADLRALTTYATRARTNLSARRRTAEENRGRQIFDSVEAGCAMCHQDGGLRGDGSQRDVGTGGTFDTPSLRFVGGTAPYMHDGRYATLREMFVRTEGQMGRTRHLGEKDMLALLAYLRSLE